MYTLMAQLKCYKYGRATMHMVKWPGARYPRLRGSSTQHFAHYSDQFRIKQKSLPEKDPENEEEVEEEAHRLDHRKYGAWYLKPNAWEKRFRDLHHPEALAQIHTFHSKREEEAKVLLKSEAISSDHTISLPTTFFISDR